MRSTRVAAVGVTLAGALVLAACGGGSGSSAAGGDCVVKIGSVFSTTGAAAAFGIDGQNSIDMAVKDINAKDFTVAGKQCTFELKSADMQSNPDNMARNAQDLITGFGAHYLIGGDMSPAIPPMVTAAERTGNVMALSVTTSMQNYVKPDKPFFKLSASDDKMVNNGYIPAVTKALPDIKRIAMLMNNDDTGRALADSYVPAFAQNGVEVTQKIFFDPASQDFAAVVNQIPRGSVDGIFIGYNGDGRAAAIMDAALDAGLTKNFITRGISALPGQQRAAKIDNYAWLVLGADPAFPGSDKVKDFIGRYAAEYKMDPAKVTWFPFTHYDYIAMLAQAMEKAGTTDDVDKVAAALRGASYDGVVQVSFDPSGANTSPMGAGILTPTGGKVVTFGIS